MNKKIFLSAVCLGSILLLGAGCSDKNSLSKSDLNKIDKAIEKNTASSDGVKGGSDVYDEAIEVVVDDPFVNKARTDIMPLIEKIFGTVKITGYYNMSFSGTDNKDDGTAIFTSKNVIGATEGSKAIQMLKDNGYKIVASTQEGKDVTVAAQKGGQMFTLNFSLGGQTINTSVITTAQ